MRKLLAAAALVASLAAAPVVRAQTAMPTGTTEPAPARFRGGAGLVIGLPHGDWTGNDPSDGDATISPGFELDFGYAVTPNIIVGAYLRHMFVQTKGETDGDISITTTDLGPMIRYELPSGNMVLFADLAIYLSTLQVSIDVSGFSFSASEDGAGVGARAGVRFPVSPLIHVAGSVGATFSHITGEGEDEMGNPTEESIDLGWITVSGDLVFVF